MNLLLDYDNMGIYGVMELWTKIRPLLARMKKKVVVVDAWRSGGGHGIHVELRVEEWGDDPWMTVACQAIFGSDRVRELHNLDRIAAGHAWDFNRLWENHKPLSATQLKMLRGFWK